MQAPNFNFVCSHIKMKYDMFVGEFYRQEENVSKIYDGILSQYFLFNLFNESNLRWPIEIDFSRVVHDKDVANKKGRRNQQDIKMR